MNREPGRGLSRRRCSIASLICVDRDAGLLLDRRQAVLLEVVEVVGDQDVKNLAARDVGRELQEQAFLEVARTDARRVELLDQREGFLGLGHA